MSLWIYLQEVLDLAFSIIYDVEEYSLNFIAPSRTDVSRNQLEVKTIYKKVTEHKCGKVLVKLVFPSASSACGQTD